MSETKRFRDLIPSILADCSSIEEYLANPDFGERTTREFLEKLQTELGKLPFFYFNQLMQILLDDGLWRELSTHPKEFDKRLDLMLRRLKSSMKSLYSIPSHRPVKNAERDRRILELKRADPSRTAGRIAIEIGLLPKQEGTVDMVLRRARERDRDSLRQLLEALADLEDLLR